MFQTLLIANRGEIACRIIRTARRLGIRSVAVFSEADAHAQHVRLADVAFPIGPARASDSYLRIDRILEAARLAGAEAIHPGYGFLSENADFAEACMNAGIVFVGPPASAIRAMGSKAESKRLMAAAGVPIVPGYHGVCQDDATLIAAADQIGFPVLIKASAGGGGKGMRTVMDRADFSAQLEGARREAKAAFGDERVLLERYLTKPRHVEVQVFADNFGTTLHLHTRDCSVQRRHQKVLEEAPAPGLSAAMQERLHDAAIAAARAVNYVSAGTVEFIVEGENAYFMEMNTRLQVEHPVTEMITGLDLVEWQLRIAAGEALPIAATPAPRGHAVEVRLYAEDPAKEFRPSTGLLRVFRLPPPAADLRLETGVAEGDSITPFYDPMIAKLVAWGEDRSLAFARLLRALAESQLSGIASNLDFLARLVDHPAMGAVDLDTGFIARHAKTLLPPAMAAPPLAIAAAALAFLPEERVTSDPWDRNTAWRLQGGGSLLLHIGEGESVHYLRLARDGQHWRLKVGEADHRLSGAVETHSVLCNFDGVIHRIPIFRDGELISIVLGSRRWQFRRIDPYAPSVIAGADAGVLAAPIPGRVVQVLVTAGEAVSRGQVLIVLEAMKTEIRVVAPIDGEVSALHCAVGETVEDGVELVTLVASS